MVPAAVSAPAVNRPASSMLPMAGSAVQVTSPLSMATGRLYQVPPADSFTVSPVSNERELTAAAEPFRVTVSRDSLSTTRTGRLSAGLSEGETA